MILKKFEVDVVGFGESFGEFSLTHCEEISERFFGIFLRVPICKY